MTCEYDTSLCIPLTVGVICKVIALDQGVIINQTCITAHAILTGKKDYKTPFHSPGHIISCDQIFAGFAKRYLFTCT